MLNLQLFCVFPLKIKPVFSTFYQPPDVVPVGHRDEHSDKNRECDQTGVLLFRNEYYNERECDGAKDR
jgi:hypothetical protein